LAAKLHFSSCFFVIKNVSNNTNYLSSIKISQKRLPLYNGDSGSLVTGRVFFGNKKILENYILKISFSSILNGSRDWNRTFKTHNTNHLSWWLKILDTQSKNHNSTKTFFLLWKNLEIEGRRSNTGLMRKGQSSRPKAEMKQFQICNIKVTGFSRKLRLMFYFSSGF
jgi:hypothetical protein